MQWLNSSVVSLIGLFTMIAGAVFGWKALRRETQKSRAEQAAAVDARIERLLAERDRDHKTEVAGLLRELAAMEKDRDYYRGRSDALGTPRRESSP